MSGPNGDPNISIDDGIIEDEDEFNEEEYAAIDSMLDQISSCLDDIEERNESLNGKLQELLESNRAARRDFRQQSQHPPHPPPDEEQRGQQHPPQEKPSLPPPPSQSSSD